MKNMLVTGGCGFIGTNFIRYLLEESDFEGRVVNVDTLTYAGNPENLSGIEAAFPERYVFIKGDICHKEAMAKGLYDKVLLYNGQRVRHYGASNQMEYFAESTEAYFGMNDFYPFVRAELKEHDPKGYALMVKIWGRVR